MVRALERGLSLSDFDYFTIGGILDYIITYNNLSNEDANEEEYEGSQEASQADFDKF